MERDGKGRLGEPVINQHLALGACNPPPPSPPNRRY